MPVDAGRDFGLGRLRDSGSERGVGTPTIVMHDELVDHQLQVPLVQRDEIVQTLATDGADEPLAKGVRLRRTNWSFEDAQAEASESSIHVGREDRIAVVDHEAIRMVEHRDSRNCCVVHSAVG